MLIEAVLPSEREELEGYQTQKGVWVSRCAGVQRQTWVSTGWALFILLEGCCSAPFTLRDQGCSASVGESVFSIATPVSSKNREQRKQNFVSLKRKI